MSFEELVATIEQQRFDVKYNASIALEYQGNGWNGYNPIGTAGWVTAGCYSPICKNKCDMVVRPQIRKQQLNIGEWDTLLEFMKQSNHTIRKMVKEYPPDHESFTMRFNCGHGYLNYLVFSMWRSAIFSPKSVVFLQYFMEMGYTSQESYVLLQECRGIWRSTSSWDRLLLRGIHIKPGLVKRLVSIRRYAVHSGYSMEMDVVKRTACYRLYKKKPFVAVGGFFGEIFADPWVFNKENFTKEALDNVLEYYKEGRTQ